jgi:Sec-independent protein translocase protein TatA
LARGLGLGLKEFKKATKDIKDEVENTVKDLDEETPEKDK